jgi:hypothetical protein
MLEASLLKLFDETDEPDIFVMRETLSRLAGLVPKPNADIIGSWIIYWANREGATDRVFGTGATIEENGAFGLGFGGKVLQEFLIRFFPKREGRRVEAAEIIRKLGPFPNESNVMKGSYEAEGTRGLSIKLDDIKTLAGEEVEVKGEKIASKKIQLDVLYASKTMVALQAEGEQEGDFEFFVLTPIEDMNRKQEQLLGLERRRFLFN